MRNFSVIVAATQQSQGIGYKNSIPWRLKPDMEEFKRLTLEAKEGMQNAVIMGRKTWESIPKRFRPLPGRINVVLTRSKPEEKYETPGAVQASSLKQALAQLPCTVDKVFIAGGSTLYAEALKSPYCEHVFLTTIFKEYLCDTFFPRMDLTKYELKSAGTIQQQDDVQFQFLQYTKRHEEHQYLDLIASCITVGNIKSNRTGIDCHSHFGKQMKFSLRDGVFPLLTTKTVFWRGVVEELLWLIKGSTDSKNLSAKRVKIWDGNGSREFLDKLGFEQREIGDLGPVYGYSSFFCCFVGGLSLLHLLVWFFLNVFVYGYVMLLRFFFIVGHQWRHFGAPYIDCHTDYSGQGVDQLADVIHKIKTDPNDRRIIMSAWNPSQLNSMALPPCHVLCQFYVFDGELSCLLFQRSGDCGLGVPFNIASYSLLTCIIAHVCGLSPGDFVHFIGDTHVYSNHIEALKMQLTREPRPFPKLHINPTKKNIDDFVFEDFTLTGYTPHDAIKMDMAL